MSVAHTHAVGKGFPDIICCSCKSNQNYLFEIKDPDKLPSQRKLTPDEKEFHKKWQGQIDIIETVEDALKIIGILK